MREPPKMTMPQSGELMATVVRRFARELSAVTEWIAEAVEQIKVEQRHLDDCPAAGYGECTCGVEQRPC